MSKQIVRPYELSLWTLQDSFITVLESPNLSYKGQIQDPIVTLKTDGTQEITFSIPMYIFNGVELIENPIWYNVTNGALIANLRKVKVIFNKGEKGLEKIYEFIIEKVTESHQEGMLICEVSGSGLAFQELGKSGYKLYFGLDSFEEDYKKWFEQKNPNPNEEPVANIDYWAKKLVEGTNWDYEVCMDWSAYDGILNDSERTGAHRQTNKVYEDEYVASWQISNNSLTPKTYETFQEKARIVSVEKSNRYNISQTIAETFGVFCRYEYEYDDNYHIISRKIVFYNTFLDEKNGKIDIEYPYHTNSIRRELDSADVTTKLYVTPVSEESLPSGLITIADVSANRTYDDFILNFDYLYSIGTISQEQYDYVSEYETKIYIINQELNPLLNKINDINSQLPQLKAELTVAQDSQKLANDEIKKAQDALRAIVGDEVLERTDGNPEHAVLLKDNTLNSYYINVTQEGVLANTIKVYKKYENGSVKELETSYTIKKDEFGNVTRLSGFRAGEGELNFRYLTYQYMPKLQYNNIVEYYRQVIGKNSAKASELESQIDELEKELAKTQTMVNQKIEEKDKENANFERLMGPALREGSWQADEYKNYGDKGQESINYIGAVNSNKIVKSYWNDTPFEGEQLSYYESGVNQERKNYYVLNINSYISDLIASGLDNIFLIQERAEGTDSIYNKKLGINSDMQYAFFEPKNGDSVIATIIITDQTFDLNEGKCRLAKVNITNEDGSLSEEVTTIRSLVSEDFLDLSNYIQVYPRIKIESDLAQTDDSSLIVKNAIGRTLKKYEEYSVLLKDLFPYIVPKSQVILSNGISGGYTVSYSLSNASLALYLDALEVSRDNAYPKASYEVELNVFDKDFLKDAYNLLGRIAHINDYELHFDNVQGYISEITLNLDLPWEDKFVTQNYKTKFEDLFSRIVASSEQMKTNALVYDRAASAFDSNGALKKENIQLSLNQSDLNYSFANGTLTINEQDGIWGVSDSGVVAFRGGGIFTANSRDAVGNWIWNSGITPNGINAALLTAGQIDTNLIRVYAGDNVRFQLNADGLFAYRSDADGNSTANNYVVHNSEGLFLTAPTVKNDGTAETYDKVEISWDGLIIRNPEYITTENPEGKVFYADEDGNLRLEGYIYARGGEIGGWGLDKTSLFSLGNTINEKGEIVKTDVSGGFGMASAALLKDDATIDENTVSNNNSYVVFWAGRDYSDIDIERGLYNDKFQVLSDGTLKASGVTIEGTINATGGKIGNLTIQEIEDGAKGAKSVQLVPITGTNFYISSIIGGSGSIIDPTELKFEIKYNGALSELTPTSLSLEWDGGDGTYVPINGLTLPETATSFELTPSQLGNGSVKTGNIRLTVTFNEEEDSYEAYSQIGFISNGRDGEDGQDATADRAWLEFNYDNYYKWYNTDQKLVESYGAYIFSPTMMKVAIAYEGANGKAYHPKGEYSLKAEVYKTDWNDITSLLTYNSTSFTYSLEFSKINKSIWNFETIRISIVRNEKIIFSEVKVIAFGTSEQAAKFDFLASGAYITTAGINYQFNDQGFSITKYDMDENHNIITGSDNKIFYVDEFGNLQISGKIEAISGSIGNWVINEDGIVSNYNSPYTTGVTATKQSIYYRDLNDRDNLNAFLIADGKVPEESDTETINESSKGTQPVFYAGSLEKNRICLHQDDDGDWNTFQNNNTTYTYSVLASGLVYAKNLVLDGSLFLNDKISFMDSAGNLDQHVFLIKNNDNYSSQNPISSESENVFLGIQKEKNEYKLSITHKGSIFAAGDEIFIGASGIFIKALDNGETYSLASGFSTKASAKDGGRPFLWAGFFAKNTPLEQISIDNTYFLVDGTGATHIKKGFSSNFNSDELFTPSLTLNKPLENDQKRLNINGTNSYIDYAGNAFFNPLYSNNLHIYEAGNDNQILLSHNGDSASISGLINGNINTFLIQNDGTGIFKKIEANEIQTSLFTTEKIATLNGSLLITNRIQYNGFLQKADTDGRIKYTFNIENPLEQGSANIGDLISIENNSNSLIVHLVVVEKTDNQISAKILEDNFPLIEEDYKKGILFVIGNLKTLVTVVSVLNNAIIFSVEESIKNLFNNYVNITNSSFTSEEGDIIGVPAIVQGLGNDNVWLIEVENTTKKVGDTFFIKNKTDYEFLYSRIYLRALNEKPEIIFYRSLYLEDNPYGNYKITSHLNQPSLILKIGDLSNITDLDFGDKALTGSGIYGENVYLKGSLVLPSAGVTNDSNVLFNYGAWSNGTPTNEDFYDNSPIRFWAGKPGTDRQTAPLIITENGSLFASQGIFKGQIIAENGVFSGSITSTGVILKNSDNEESDFFFVAYKTSGDYSINDYIIDVTEDNGLEIYDNAFCVFSGISRNEDKSDIYLDYTDPSFSEGSFSYQFPYISAIQESKSLVAYNINTLSFETSEDNLSTTETSVSYTYRGLRQTSSGFEWYSSKVGIDVLGSTSANSWRNYYKDALNTNRQLDDGKGNPVNIIDYSVNIGTDGMNFGQKIDDTDFTMTQEGVFKFVKSNCIIEQIPNSGINIRCLS